jgi:CheY-like chemotaxis protein
MAMKELFTTGEAAKLLDISRSTVSRKFDKGVLLGKKNQITGERMINRESIAAFLKKHDMPVEPLGLEKKKILIGSSDERLFALVQKAFAKDGRVQLESIGYGCDVLIGCSKERPDLLIIDEELPDVSSTDIMKSLRRMEELKDIKILCFAKKADKRPLEWGADAVLSKDSPEGELAKKVYSLLEISEKPEEFLKFEHQRKSLRMALRFPTKILVYPLNKPYRREPGKATVENISYGGCYISGIELENNMIPAEPFRFMLEVNQPPLKNWRAHCKVVRLQSNGALTAGVQFVRLSQQNRRTLGAIFQ